MSDMTKFGFDGNEVRIVMGADGEPLFVAKDILLALGYEISGGLSKYISHVPDEWKVGGIPISTPSGTQQMAVLKEQGVYFFVARSDKKKALDFQKWLAGEVVPSIRKTGSYSAPSQPDSQIPTAGEQLLMIAQALVSNERAILALETNQAQLKDGQARLAQATRLLDQRQKRLEADIDRKLDEAWDQDKSLNATEAARLISLSSAQEFNRVAAYLGWVEPINATKVGNKARVGGWRLTDEGRPYGLQRQNWVGTPGLITWNRRAAEHVRDVHRSTPSTAWTLDKIVRRHEAA